MTTVVIRTCDKCKKEVPDGEQLWNVAITCETVGYHRQYHTTTKQQQAEWCRPCVDVMGVFVGLLRAENQEPPKVTFEDLVREIVEECNNGRD